MIKMKTIIPTAVAALIASALFVSNASADYSLHDSCHKAWRSSVAYKEQGCKLYRINFNHAHAGQRYCYHDVYCDRGAAWQRAGRKGVIWIESLGQLRRCAGNPTKIETYCVSITNEQLRSQSSSSSPGNGRPY